jgi:hypothetical protein
MLMIDESIDDTGAAIREDTDIDDDTSISVELAVGLGRMLNSEELATSPFEL